MSVLVTSVIVVHLSLMVKIIRRYPFDWQVLLTSDKAAANFSDRSLLKNLGHWLGMITLAKNKPILYTVRACWHLPFCQRIKCWGFLLKSKVIVFFFFFFSGSGTQIFVTGSLCERPAGAALCGPFCGQSFRVKSSEHGEGPRTHKQRSFH